MTLGELEDLVRNTNRDVELMIPSPDGSPVAVNVGRIIEGYTGDPVDDMAENVILPDTFGTPVLLLVPDTEEEVILSENEPLTVDDDEPI